MNTTRLSRYLASASFIFASCIAANATAQDFNVPSGDLKSALDAYATQSGTQLMYGDRLVEGVQTKGLHGALSPDAALARILRGTGFEMRRDASGAIAIVRTEVKNSQSELSLQIAQAAPARATVETVTVTSSKLGGADVQTVPISITALSQEQLTSTQTAGGPDLVKQVPNLTFTKTNFTGYNIQIRGIGTQAISVTTDPAVAVAFNDIPFIRNHFFEQEFFDVSQVEVLRGPQGTLYGRNATAGVVNLISAKPTDHYEAMASIDVGNYNNRRLEAMLNVPVVSDKLDVRVAGEWTKRDGYAFNDTTKKPIDGRNLWSSRVTVGLKPIDQLQIYAIWEHFDEEDDRVRSTKQLCKKDRGPTSIDGLDITGDGAARAMLSQGCLPKSFYSPEAFQTPNGQSNPLVAAGEFFFYISGQWVLNQIDPYASITQSKDLRIIQSEIDPTYRAKNDTFELNADLAVTPSLTLTSQSAYNKDVLRSTEDFNRFNTAPGLFATIGAEGSTEPPVAIDGVYCDPQLGCSDKMVAEDLSQERAWQFSQEFRLASSFDGSLNFSIGGNYMHYQTTEDYYVFLNLITAMTQFGNKSGAGDYSHCYLFGQTRPHDIPSTPYYNTALSDAGQGPPVAMPSEYVNFGCYDEQDYGPGQYLPGTYIDPNPITALDGQGHNYFRSQNPYRLNSFAGFGEVYYQIMPDLKLTGGLRWTDDSKRFWNIPSWVFLRGGGYPVQGIVDQTWKEFSGRFNATWTPTLDFTDQTMLYASYSRGYKGGGANPPGPQTGLYAPASFATHPPTFEPEFVNAFEVGTKNAFMDDSVTLNASAFYYDYKDYQISQIVDRTSINLNFDAKVKGAEIEATWEPLPGLRFNFAGGIEDSSVSGRQSAIDLMDRTAGHADWMVVRPGVTETSNCIMPTYVMKKIVQMVETVDPINQGAYYFLIDNPCDVAYVNPSSPLFNFATLQSIYSITDFDPATAPNNGAGFSKDLGGNKLPNTPPFTLSLGAQYSMPVSKDWAATLREDFYWQGNTFARIFNDKPYDQIKGYTNLNLALIFTNQDGWQAMAYVKNVFDTTAITGAFLNSDDTSLTTNVFVTDPRLFGIRITKNW